MVRGLVRLMLDATRKAIGLVVLTAVVIAMTAFYFISGSK